MELTEAEAAEEEEKQNADDEPERVRLPAFDKLKVSIKLLNGPLDGMYHKSAYKGRFDVALLGLKADNIINEDFKVLMKENGKIYLETADNLVLFKKEQQEEYRKKMAESAEKAGWVAEESAWDTYCLYKVN